MKSNITMKSIIMIAIALMTMMVGCKKTVEQSQISIDDFKEKATIIGTLTYDEGQGYDGTNYTRLIKPAANVSITAIIAGSEFSETAAETSYLTFTTKTNADGNFELTLPVTNDGVDVRVKISSFTGQYHRIIDVNNGQTVYSDKDVVYFIDDKQFRLEPNDIEVFDGIFEYEERENADTYNYHSKYQVVVGQSAYIKSINDNDVPEVIKEYEKATNVDVIINVYHDGETYRYAASTDSEGVATFNIPTQTLNWNPEITITVNSYTEDKFSYYKLETDEESGEIKAIRHTLSGYFEQTSGFESSPQFNSIEGMPTPECRVKMNFVPFDENEDNGCSEEYWGNVEF